MNPELFRIEGEAHEREPLHWRECGLDNIFLLNGFTREIMDGEEYVTVENLDGLWKAVGLHLVAKQKTLGPREVRFLRHHMDLTQAELARYLRVSDQTVARWEKGETPLPGPADVAIRSAYLASAAVQPEGRKILDRLLEMLGDLTDTDEGSPAALNFRHGNHRWREEERQAA
jgi:DNA-binding transcriptional regulator YiaG